MSSTYIRVVNKQLHGAGLSKLTTCMYVADIIIQVQNVKVQDVRLSPAAETMFPICRHDNDKLLNDSREGGISS